MAERMPTRNLDRLKAERDDAQEAVRVLSERLRVLGQESGSLAKEVLRQREARLDREGRRRV